MESCGSCADYFVKAATMVRCGVPVIYQIWLWCRPHSSLELSQNNIYNKQTLLKFLRLAYEDNVVSAEKIEEVELYEMWGMLLRSSKLVAVKYWIGETKCLRGCEEKIEVQPNWMQLDTLRKTVGILRQKVHSRWGFQLSYLTSATYLRRNTCLLGDVGIGPVHRACPVLWAVRPSRVWKGWSDKIWKMQWKLGKT